MARVKGVVLPPPHPREASIFDSWGLEGAGGREGAEVDCDDLRRGRGTASGRSLFVVMLSDCRTFAHNTLYTMQSPPV